MMSMFFMSVTALRRCTNTLLKKEVDISKMWEMTESQLSRLYERCGRLLQPIIRDGEQEPSVWFCPHCDGPLERSERGLHVLAAYKARRKLNPPTM